MKNKMPLDGLGLGHDSGSVHCDMLKMLCFRTAWGGGVNNINQKLSVNIEKRGEKVWRNELLFVHLQPK